MTRVAVGSSDVVHRLIQINVQDRVCAKRLFCHLRQVLLDVGLQLLEKDAILVGDLALGLAYSLWLLLSIGAIVSGATRNSHTVEAQIIGRGRRKYYPATCTARGGKF